MPMTTHQQTFRQLKVFVASMFLGLSAVYLSACTPWASQDAYHSDVIRGEIVSLEGSSGTINIGKSSNAEVGQVFNVIRRKSNYITGIHRAPLVKRVKVGQVRITRIVGDRYSEVEVVSGEIREADTVELKNKN